MPNKKNEKEYAQAKAEAVSRYRRTLRENIRVITSLRDGSLSERYPQLSAYAQSYHSGKLFEKLEGLLEYFAEYGIDNAEQPVSYNRHAPRSQKRGRGVEMMLSQQAAAQYIDKEGNEARRAELGKAWRVVFAKLRVLDLIRVYAPKLEPQPSPWNTREEQYSADKAIESERPPVRWWHVPKYGPGTLQKAEKRVCVVKELGARCTDMDAVRDALARLEGVEKAEQDTRVIFDDGKGKPTVNTERRINLLCAALVYLLGDCVPYAPETMVLDVALPIAAESEADWIRHDWKTFRSDILQRCNVVYARPTDEQKKRWNLQSNAYILTAAGKLPDDIPPLETFMGSGAELEEPGEDTFPF